MKKLTGFSISGPLSVRTTYEKSWTERLALIVSCLAIGLVIGLVIACLYRDTADFTLSIFLGILASILVYSLFLVYEWADSWQDLEETGFHMQDPRHPHNPAYVSEAEIQEGLEELKAKQGIQITPRGDVMLHSNPECYTSPFSLN